MNYAKPKGYVLALATAKTIYLRPDVSYCIKGYDENSNYHPMPNVYVRSEPIENISFYDETMYARIFENVRSVWSLSDRKAFRTVYDIQNPFNQTYIKTMGVLDSYDTSKLYGMFQLLGPEEEVKILNPPKVVRDYWDIDLEDQSPIEPGRDHDTRFKETNPTECCWRDAEASPKTYGGTYGGLSSIRHLIVEESSCRHVWCGRFPLRSITVRRFESHEHFERSVQEYFTLKGEENEDFY